jgi:hypothetical protein
MNAFLNMDKRTFIDMKNIKIVLSKIIAYVVENQKF